MSVEEFGSTLVLSFFQEPSLGQSQVRGSLTRLGLARLISKISQIKKKGGGTSATSVAQVGESGGREVGVAHERVQSQSHFLTEYTKDENSNQHRYSQSVHSIA